MVRSSGFVKQLEKWNIIERKSNWSLTCFKPSHCELVWVLIVSSSSNPTKPFSRRSTIRCSYCKRPKPGKSRWCIAQSSWTCFPSWISVAAALRTWGVRRFNARDLPLVPVSSLLPTLERTYFRVHPSSHLCQKTPRDSLVVDPRPAEAHRKEEIHNSSWLPYCNVSIVFGCLLSVSLRHHVLQICCGVPRRDSRGPSYLRFYINMFECFLQYFPLLCMEDDKPCT